MRQLKFRAWDGKKMHDKVTLDDEGRGIKHGYQWFSDGNTLLHSPIMQFTGLLDKNGKEIYELHEIDNQYRVVYDKCSYVLQDISNGDIIGLLDNTIRGAHEREITGEYSPLA